MFLIGDPSIQISGSNDVYTPSTTFIARDTHLLGFAFIFRVHFRNVSITSICFITLSSLEDIRVRSSANALFEEELALNDGL